LTSPIRETSPKIEWEKVEESVMQWLEGMSVKRGLPEELIT
jgi:hypothetical protein